MENKDMPAMPELHRDPFGNYHKKGGLTKREMFAMHAMQAQISAMGNLEAASMFTDAMNERGIPLDEPEKLVAINALNYADALLKELDNGN